MRWWKEQQQKIYKNRNEKYNDRTGVFFKFFISFICYSAQSWMAEAAKSMLSAVGLLDFINFQQTCIPLEASHHAIVVLKTHKSSPSPASSHTQPLSPNFSSVLAMFIRNGDDGPVCLVIEDIVINLRR